MTLAECIARATDKSQIPDVLRAFESLRRQRCEVIQAASARNAEIWHLPDGEEQKARDAGMRQGGPEKESAGAKNPNQWSDPKFQPWLFGYDAVKEANRGLDLWFDQQKENAKEGNSIDFKL